MQKIKEKTVYIIKNYLKTSILIIIILVLSLTPGNIAERESLIKIKNFDKIVHFFMYLTLYFSIVYEIKEKYLANLIFILLITNSFGCFMEICQETFIRNRSGEIYDLLANFFGSLIGVITSIIFFKIKRIKIS